jgi:hypothetical protein
VIGTPAASNVGTYAYDLRGLANGEYRLRVISTDVAGNSRVSADTFQFVVDTSASPVTRMELAPAAGNDTGDSPYDNITSNTTPTVRVWFPRNAVAGDQVRINTSTSSTYSY